MKFFLASTAAATVLVSFATARAQAQTPDYDLKIVADSRTFAAEVGIPATPSSRFFVNEFVRVSINNSGQIPFAWSGAQTTLPGQIDFVYSGLYVGTPEQIRVLDQRVENLGVSPSVSYRGAIANDAGVVAAIRDDNVGFSSSIQAFSVPNATLIAEFLINSAPGSSIANGLDLNDSGQIAASIFRFGEPEIVIATPTTIPQPNFDVLTVWRPSPVFDILAFSENIGIDAAGNSYFRVSSAAQQRETVLRANAIEIIDAQGERFEGGRFGFTNGNIGFTFAVNASGIVAFCDDVINAAGTAIQTSGVFIAEAGVARQIFEFTNDGSGISRCVDIAINDRSEVAVVAGRGDVLRTSIDGFTREINLSDEVRRDLGIDTPQLLVFGQRWFNNNRQIAISVGAADAQGGRVLIVRADPVEPPLPGDLDGDGDIDRDDIARITAARGQPVTGADDPRDIDGDGLITALDARRLTALCTRPRCATQ